MRHLPRTAACALALSVILSAQTWIGYTYPDPADYRAIAWTGAFQAAGDEKAYYLALHEYVCSIPDRHVSLNAENPTAPTALGRELAGGGFGMAVAEMDDWRVIAAAIVPEGPADRAGMVAGAKILTWGAVPATTAIGRIDVGAVPFTALAGGHSPC